MFLWCLYNGSAVHPYFTADNDSMPQSAISSAMDLVAYAVVITSGHSSRGCEKQHSIVQRRTITLAAGAVLHTLREYYTPAYQI